MRAPSVLTSAAPAFDRQAALDAIAAYKGGDKCMDLTFLQTISAASMGKKRALSLGNASEFINDEGTTSSDGSESTEKPKQRGAKAAASSQQAKKQRIPTHVLRKEEKERLEEELLQLEARAALLRHETGVADPREIRERRALGAKLRDAIKQQDLLIANSQSAFSSFMNLRTANPLETYIHLTTDWQQRRTVLLDMKDAKIRDANRFLVERTRHMNLFKASGEFSHFESNDGDLFATKIDVTPFEGIKSVRQAFDAMYFYFTNVEISLTEMLGNVTIREDDDDTDKAVLHHRLVTTEPPGVLVEKNVVVFIDQSDFDDPELKPEDHWAIAASDFVDQDDLYPYCPTQRIRKDFTSVFKLSAHRCPKRSQNNSSVAARSEPAAATEGNPSGGESELVVVLTRWFLVRLRCPTFDIPKDDFHAIMSAQMTGVDVMVRSMHQGMLSSQPCPPPPR